MISLLLAISLAEPVVVTLDNTKIARSCIVKFDGKPIPDTDDNGVIQIDADRITIEFAEQSELWGCDPQAPGDKKRGIGIALNGHKNVTIKNARIHGFKVGLRAVDCDGLKIDGGDFSDNFRQHLLSTPKKEDERDWMSFHHNDKDEAVEQYGAAIFIKNAKSVELHDVLVRRGQNGIVLSRVNDSKIYDNDCSLLSGWGLAMWRSSGNTVSRNAFDFCVRGYSHNVYNRGQDSAGIIAFEQCCKNIFAENSVTHGGDGFFAFAGLEALNGEGAPKDFDFKLRGCNDNLLIDNDFSDAVAHGIEITFSFANKIIRNRISNNGICGIWAGFSQRMTIEENDIADNGAMGNGLERGGVNIDHSADNAIFNNSFTNNACGVYLWWHAAAEIQNSPWGKANYRRVEYSVILRNRFVVNEKQIGIQIRDQGENPGENVIGVAIAQNDMQLKGSGAIAIDLTPGVKVSDEPGLHSQEIPLPKLFGRKKLVGAHPELRGRDKIVIDEWGPTIKP